MDQKSGNYLVYFALTFHDLYEPIFSFIQALAIHDGWMEQCFTSLPTQYRLYGRQFLQVKRPNQCTEGTHIVHQQQCNRRTDVHTTRSSQAT